MSLVVPSSWENLEQFALWYKRNSMPIRIPADSRVYVTEQTYSTVLFRQGRFQAEMYFAHPDTISTKHSHPFDQIVLFLGGKISGSRADEQWSILGNEEKLPSNHNKDLPHPDSGKLGKKLEKGQWHQLTAHESGFCFIVLQDWGDLTPSSAIVAYDGDELGEQHKALQETLNYGRN
jgi:hypothetical protein